jgi:hypothetical protein
MREFDALLADSDGQKDAIEEQLRQLSRPTGSESFELAAAWRRALCKNTAFSLLQIPDSRTYMSRGDFWKAEPLAQSSSSHFRGKYSGLQ